MGKNTGDNYRKGSVKERSQVYNSKTSQYIKRDSNKKGFRPINQWHHVPLSPNFVNLRKRSST